jgi:hypothetical protein
MSQTPPQTGDPVVDEVLARFHGTHGQSLGERADAARVAQRRLQERLSESAPGQDTASATERVAEAPHHP